MNGQLTKGRAAAPSNRRKPTIKPTAAAEVEEPKAEEAAPTQDEEEADTEKDPSEFSTPEKKANIAHKVGAINRNVGKMFASMTEEALAALESGADSQSVSTILIHLDKYKEN